ncbi:MAG: hypothetical protein OXN97_11010 [Bryobacterales bacterium]|nr:hypothetical protein [Bryobacterales bacterium]
MDRHLFSRTPRPSRTRGPLSLCLLAVLSATASEPAAEQVAINRPTVASAFPLSVRAGEAADVAFSGNYLDQVRRIRCECTDVNVTVLSGNPLEVHARIEASASASPGPRFLAVETPKGQSNRVMFRVTGWPSVVESEPNESYRQAQPVPTPVLIEGRIETVHDSDMFRFRADAGERLAFNVLTGRSRAPGHVVAILMTASGRVLDRNLSRFGTDPYLDHVFAEAGEYILTVIPRRFSDFYTILFDDTKINWQYELAIGRSPILWSLFPMGGRRGSSVETELRADFLDPESEPQFSNAKLSASLEPWPDPCGCRYRLNVDIAEDAPTGVHHLTFPDPSGTLMPLAFSVGDSSEAIEREPNDGLHEAQRISLPLVLNGRIDDPGDIDGFLFTVDQYDEVAFEVDAKGLGSHITDPNLTLVRPDGELIDRGDDRCRQCGQYFNAVRRKQKLDSKFWHYFQTGNPNDADAAGDYVLQLRDNSARGGRNHPYRLTVRKKVPGFRLGVLQDSVQGPLGGVAGIPLILRPEEGFAGGVAVRAAGLPPGLVAEPLELRTDEPAGALVIRHHADAAQPEAVTGWVQAHVRVLGTARINGKEVERAAELPSFYTEDGAGYNEVPRTEVLVSFVQPADFSLGIEEPFRGFRMDLANGNRVDTEVSVARAEGFGAPLEFEPVEFPPGLRLEAEPEEQGKVRIALIGEPSQLEARSHRIAIRASATADGRRTTEVTRGFGLQVK